MTGLLTCHGFRLCQRLCQSHCQLCKRDVAVSASDDYVTERRMATVGPVAQGSSNELLALLAST